jgi:hypothetical protein
MVASAAVLALASCASLQVQWTHESQEVDIATGRLRFTRYSGDKKVSERIEDTSLSRALLRDNPTGAGPSWRCANTFARCKDGFSHDDYHILITQMSELRGIWQDFAVSDVFKKRTAEHLVALWQYGGVDDWPAGSYLRELQSLMASEASEEIRRSILTLEITEIRGSGDRSVRTVFYPDGKPMVRIEGYVSGDGAFVRHGVIETRWSNGQRFGYGRVVQGLIDGPLFIWDDDGTLMSIGSFSRGELIGIEKERLEDHPDYGTAQRLRAAESARHRDGRE